LANEATCPSWFGKVSLALRSDACTWRTLLFTLVIFSRIFESQLRRLALGDLVSFSSLLSSLRFNGSCEKQKATELGTTGAHSRVTVKRDTKYRFRRAVVSWCINFFLQEQVCIQNILWWQPDQPATYGVIQY
jgi:hypothetical protein